MEKRHFNRKRGLAAVVAAAALSSTLQSANAGIVFQLTTATGNNTMGATSLNVTNDAAFNLDVWATVTGTDGSSTNDGLQIANLNFKSQDTGQIKGDFNALTSPTSPWNANGSSAGTQQNLDLDADLDLGSTNTALASGWWIARAGQVQTSADGKFKLGTIQFDPSALGTGTATDLTVSFRNSANGVLWFEDSTINTVPNPDVWSNDKNPTTGSASVLPFVLTATVGGGGNPFEWNVDASGNWNTPGNWGTNDVPNVPGENATFGGKITSPQTVTVDAPTTVGGLRFANANAYTIGGANNLTLAGAGVIDAASGSGHIISAPLVLSVPTTVTGSGGVSITGTLNNSSGQAIAKTGGGSLTISGVQTHGVGAALNASGGITNLNSNAGAGTLASAQLSVSASGTAQVNVNSAQDLKALNVAGTGDPGVNARSGQVTINYATSDNNELRVYDTSAGNILEMWNDIRSGNNANTWTGQGINTTIVADPNLNGLGMESETDGGANGYISVREMAIGDVNGDDFVDGADVLLMKSATNLNK